MVSRCLPAGEVGILGIVLLRVYSRTTFAIFIEIGLYLTDKEQKISWYSFLRHGVVYIEAVNLRPDCSLVPVTINVSLT